MTGARELDQVRAEREHRTASLASWAHWTRRAERDHLRSRACFGAALGFCIGAGLTAFYQASDAAVLCTGAAFVLTLAGCWFSLRAECGE